MKDAALELLLGIKKKELTVKEAVEIIELVSRDPEAAKEVLKAAEEDGLLRRDGKKIYISTASSNFSRPRIKRLDCESSCRRCGTSIKNCFYIVLEDRELGPFGSECVNKIL